MRYLIAVKLDEFGEVEWARQIGNDVNNNGKGVIQLNDGNLVALMSPDNPSNFQTSLMAVKFTAAGDMLWGVEIGNSESNT